MWQEGKEKVVIPWHEGSVFVPPTGGFTNTSISLPQRRDILPFAARPQTHVKSRLYVDQELLPLISWPSSHLSRILEP